MPPVHASTYSVYYEDTDAGGIVYYANYLKYAERARTDILRRAGLSQRALREESGVGFVVRQCSMEFHAPALLDDSIMVESDLQEMRKAAIRMSQRIVREQEKLVTLEVLLACVNGRGRPCRIPQAVQNAFTQATT